MPREVVANRFATLLTAQLGNAAGDLTVAVADPMPAALAGVNRQWRALIYDLDGSGNPQNVEIVLVNDADGASPYSIVRAQEGTARVIHPVNSILEHDLTAGGLEAAYRFDQMVTVAEQLALLAMNYAPDEATTNGTFGNGEQFSIRIWAPKPLDLTNAHVWVHTAGVATTMCKVGIMDSAGVLLSKSASIPTLFTSAGLKTAAQVAEAGQSLAGVGGKSRLDFIRVCFMFLGATTNPRFFQKPNIDANFAQAGLAVAKVPTIQATAQTDINTPNAQPHGVDGQQRIFWVAVS